MRLHQPAVVSYDNDKVLQRLQQPSLSTLTSNVTSQSDSVADVSHFQVSCGSVMLNVEVISELPGREGLELVPAEVNGSDSSIQCSIKQLIWDPISLPVTEHSHTLGRDASKYSLVTKTVNKERNGRVNITDLNSNNFRDRMLCSLNLAKLGNVTAGRPSSAESGSSAPRHRHTPLDRTCHRPNTDVHVLNSLTLVFLWLCAKNHGHVVPHTKEQIIPCSSFTCWGQG